MQHIFSANPLDRGEALRRDEDWLADAANRFDARFLPFHRLNVLLRGTTIGWLDVAGIEGMQPTLPPVFLGMLHDQPHFVVNVDAAEAPPGYRFSDCRMAAMQAPLEETGIMAQARAQLDWHRRHRFCSVCGAQSEMRRGGQLRVCPACDAQHFPRTDPVAIMLVVDDDRCLLGQPKGPLVKTGVYSALAGFIDQGESIEEAVRREVKEEAGLEVGDVRYHSSQPWPFPSSLMIGCHARAASTDIHMDTEEMHDVRWVDRDDIARAMRDEPASVKAPGPIAIAHHLIAAWLAGDVRW